MFKHALDCSSYPVLMICVSYSSLPNVSCITIVDAVKYEKRISQIDEIED